MTNEKGKNCNSSNVTEMLVQGARCKVQVHHRAKHASLACDVHSCAGRSMRHIAYDRRPVERTPQGCNRRAFVAVDIQVAK